MSLSECLPSSQGQAVRRARRSTFPRSCEVQGPEDCLPLQDGRRWPLLVKVKVDVFVCCSVGATKRICVTVLNIIVRSNH